GLERIFITGVSPVLMSDITSAYNVAEDIYMQPEFNDLCGFRESELWPVLTQIVEECKLEPQKGNDALTLMQIERRYRQSRFPYFSPLAALSGLAEFRRYDACFAV
ncbi:MAG: AAA family ATPase, partial [Gammaproteobacteria bacterium]|nr:AAA family ATPase [Gammaproteobacteria bacterium]